MNVSRRGCVHRSACPCATRTRNVRIKMPSGYAAIIKIAIFAKLCIFAGFYIACMEEKLIETIVEAIQDKKGKNIVSLDLGGFDGAICSHFVVCNADSTTQVAAIADGIEEKVFEKLGENVWRVEGKQSGLWVAMDYVDVVVHIFLTDLREYYKLEELWADAPMRHYDYEA